MNGIKGTVQTFSRRITRILISKYPENKIELPEKVNQLRANIKKRTSHFPVKADIVLTENKAQYILDIYYFIIYTEEVQTIVQEEGGKLGIILETF